MNVNHQDIVARCHAEHPPEHSAEGALAFVVRVITQLPAHERAGLLRKDAGENVAFFQGANVSAGRICYPDGQLYKILTDIPATMAPVWNDDGMVDPSRYFDIAAFLDVPPAAPSSDDPPPPAPGQEPGEPDELAQLLESMTRIYQGLDDLRTGIAAAVEEFGKRTTALEQRLGELQTNGIDAHLRLRL